MRFSRSLLAFALLVAAFSLPACGGAPPGPQDDLVETSSSALRDPNGIWIGGPNYFSGTYQCQGTTYTLYEQVQQASVPGHSYYLTTLTEWFPTTTGAAASLQSCIKGTGRAFEMHGAPGTLYNTESETCAIWTHAAGTTAWTNMGHVTIPTYSFTYTKPSPSHLQDEFDLGAVVDAVDVGKPGMCAGGISTAFRFSAP